MIIGKSQSRTAFVLFAATLVFFCVFYIYPLVMGLYISFTDWNGNSLHYSFTGLDNYRTMLADKQFNDSLSVTAKYMAIITVFSLLFGYLAASLLSRLKRHGRVMESVVILPYVMMPVMVYILFKCIFTGLIPFIGKTYGILFLNTNLLARTDTALWACAFTDIWMLVRYTSYILLAAKNKIPSSVIEAYYVLSSCMFIPVNIIFFPLIKMYYAWNLMNVFGLLLYYMACMIPECIFLLVPLLKGRNPNLKEAAALDGCSFLQYYYKVFIPAHAVEYGTVIIISFI